jgi:hypothetical protein
MTLEGRALLSQLIVSNTNDNGSGSLRAAVTQANADGGGDTIVFSSLFNTPQTITLTQGQLKLTGGATTTIEGPGANLLTISASTMNRVFDIAGGAAATLSGLTITNGFLTSGYGGGLQNAGGTLTMANCTVTGNLVVNGGSGGGLENSGTMTLTNCTLSSNTVAQGAVGAGVFNTGAMSLTNCTISGNSSGGDGGGLENSGGMALTNCTLTGNVANLNGGGLENRGTISLTDCTVGSNSADYGGGLRNEGTSMTLTNCTIAGNQGFNDGGGLSTYGAVTLTNVTVSGNISFSGVGGLSNHGTARLTNTIVAGNTRGQISGGFTDGGHNLIGGNPLLAALGNYGGPTPTLALLPGSPAIGGGATGPGIPTTDQRGLPRTGHIDVGAFQSEGFTLTPVYGSTPQTALAGKAFENPLAVRVTPANPVEPVDGGVVGFTVAPATGGATATLSAATASVVDTIAGEVAGVTATANAVPGTYTVTATSAGAGQTGLVLTNASLVVTTAQDELDDAHGLVSLRMAVGYADSLPGASTITFDTAVFGTTPQTITLTNGPLELTNPATTTIDGPGANLLTVSGNNASQVFDIAGGAAAISGLTITGGISAKEGGGLYNLRGTVSLTGCTVSGNTALDGGGLASYQGAATLTDCTIGGNTARYDGGGVQVLQGAMTLTNCTISGNTAADLGGGLNNDSGKAALTDCTISGNSSGEAGGGLFNSNVFDTITLATLTNCTVSGNAAGRGGGLDNYFGRLVLTNTIVAGQKSGGDVFGDYTGTNNLIGGDPLLAPLGDYGGPTPTMAVLPGSPAIGGGTSGVAIPTTDQRGFARGPSVDIGAYQSQGFTLSPVATSTPQSAAVGMKFANPLELTVTAHNVDQFVNPVDGGVIGFSAPATGASASLSAKSAVIANGQASVTAMANATPGTYTATATAAGATSIGFNLTNQAAPGAVQPDPGDVVLEFDDLTSLRAAIAYANSHPGPDTILFDPADSGTKPRTIRLIGGPLVLTNPAATTIVGPGAKRLKIRGNGKGSVFEVQGGSLALSGLTIAGGRAKNGGGILNDGGRLSLTDVMLRNNSARVLGGGLFNDGAATLTHVTVSGDSASVGGGIANNGTMSLTKVSIGRNFARFARGVFNSGAVRLLSR